jgi:AcrR family transcriptional regulator
VSTQGGHRVVSPVWGRGREALLTAARELFAQKGFAATGTKEIADRAAVTEPMLFRHFGSKTKLFEAAVLAPFNDFVHSYMADWSSRPRNVRDQLDEARDFYRGVYEMLSANRVLIRVLIASEVNQGPLASSDLAGPKLGAILERFEEVIRRERDERGFREFDPAVMTQLMFGMALSVAIHGDWMSNGATAPRPRPEAFIEEMARLTIYGVLRPDARDRRSPSNQQAPEAGR